MSTKFQTNKKSFHLKARRENIIWIYYLWYLEMCVARMSRDKEMPKYLYQYHFKYIHICNYICLCVCTLRRLKLRLPRYGLSVCRNVLDLS
jgi:hypothetical protein